MELVPSLIGFLGGMGAGAAYTFVRYMKQRGEKSTMIVFCFSAFSCISVLPYVIFNFVPMTAFQTAMLLLTGFAAAGGQFSITAAYTHAPAREVSVFDYTQILFSTAIGFFLFGQVPDKWSFVGYGIIIIIKQELMKPYNIRLQIHGNNTASYSVLTYYQIDSRCSTQICLRETVD